MLWEHWFSVVGVAEGWRRHSRGRVSRVLTYEYNLATSTKGLEREGGVLNAENNLHKGTEFVRIWTCVWANGLKCLDHGV